MGREQGGIYNGKIVCQESQSLKLGEGEKFHGEGVLAVTKALLQSGVSYVGGYQGAPISHLLDVLCGGEDNWACIWKPAPARPRPPPC